MRHIDTIVVHCSATRVNWMHDKGLEAQFREIKRWHTIDNKWPDIGYHGVIGRAGNYMQGRPFERSGAGVRGHNKTTIHLCLIGGHGSSASDDFSDHFTIKQGQTLMAKIDEIRARFPSIQRVAGHNEYAAKACPGFNVPAWLESHRPKREPVSPFAAFFRAIFGGRS